MSDTSALEVMAMIQRHYGVLPDDFQLPVIPTDTMPWDSRPRTPPEALAQLERARVNARTFNRLYHEAGVYIQEQRSLRPLTSLCTSRAQKDGGQPTATDEAHGTI
jgi:hypothetical protein